jgi:hypothetical protein
VQKNYRNHIKQVFIKEWVASLLLSFKAAQKLAHEHFKENADPHGAHPHVHASLPTPHGAHAHVHPGHTSVDELPQDAQMSYNNALWGAATHTRAGDSLRYL